LLEEMSFWFFFLPSLANTKSATDRKMMKIRSKAMRIIKRPMKAIMTRDIFSPFPFLKPVPYVSTRSGNPPSLYGMRRDPRREFTRKLKKRGWYRSGISPTGISPTYL
jgi:hypothetical protein